MPTFLLQQIQAIEILPGESVQPLHTDDGYVRVPRPHPPLNCATMWALDDFTETNGSTVVFPGSHLWPDEKVPDRQKDRWIHATKPAGSVTIWIGTTWHGGGANRTDETKEGPDGKGTARMGITCGHRLPSVSEESNDKASKSNSILRTRFARSQVNTANRTSAKTTTFTWSCTPST